MLFPTDTPYPTQPATDFSADIVNSQDVIGGLAWSPDGKTLAAGAFSGLYLYDSQTRQKIQTLENGHKLFSLTFAPDHPYLAAINWREATVPIWDIEDGQKTLQVLNSLSDLRSLAFSPEGKQLATGGENVIQVWDVSTGDLLLNIEAHGWVESLAFAGDGNSLLSFSGFTAQTWDLTTQQPAQSFWVQGASQVRFSPDSKSLVATRGRAGLEIWDVGSGQRRFTLKGPSSDVWFATFSADGKFLAAGGYLSPSAVYLINVETGEIVHQIEHEVGSFGEWRSVAFSPDGHTLALGDDYGHIALWEVATGQQVGKIEVR